MVKTEEIIDGLWADVYKRQQDTATGEEEAQLLQLKGELETVVLDVNISLINALGLIRLQHNKGHRVEALLAHLTRSCESAEREIAIRQQKNEAVALLQCFLHALYRLLNALWTQYADFKLMPLPPTAAFVQFFLAEMAEKAQFILDSMRRTEMDESLVNVFKRYFRNPIPMPKSAALHTPVFRSLSYYRVLVETLHGHCLLEKPQRLERLLFAELINLNFNQIGFVLACINRYCMEVEEPDELDQTVEMLMLKKAEIAAMPMLSGLAYVQGDVSLKAALVAALCEQIDYLNLRIEKRNASYLDRPPHFVLNFNMQHFLFFWNVLLQMNLIRRNSKDGIPAFVVRNFGNANGERFSLKSLQKKNSLVDERITAGLIELLERIIRFIRSGNF